jgi:signal transduction histidine kinase
MRKLWSGISAFGVREGLADPEVRSIIFVNRICAILGLFALTSILINVILGSAVFIPALSIALALLLCTYFFHHKRLYNIARVNMMLVVIALLTYMSFKGAAGSGLEFYFLSLTVLPVIVFRRNIYIYLMQFLCIACLIAQKFYADSHPLPADVDMAIFRVFYIVNATYSCLLIILAIFFFRNQNRKHESQLSSSNELIGQKNRELELLNKQAEAFNYSVSHDLRSPLRSINAMTGFLKAQYYEQLNEDGREMLDMILQSAASMQTLIQDLLAFSKAGQAALKISLIDMNKMVQDIWEEIQPQVSPRAVLKLNKLPPAQADPVLIRQVLTNLLSNALKYSAKKEAPVVEAGSYADKDQQVYFVRDNGVGFDMRYADKLFQVFQRLHSAQEYEGNGVGLAIIQNIISRHGGKVWAESRPGEGAVFYFSLPVKPVAANS